MKKLIRCIKKNETLDRLRELTAGLSILDSPKKISELEKGIDVRDRLIKVFNCVTDDEMYAEVLSIILEVFSSTKGIFGYVDKNKNFICPSLTRCVWEKCRIRNKTIIFPYSVWGGIWGEALKEKKMTYSNAIFAVPSGHISITRIMCMPIIFRECLIGLLEIANKPIDYIQGDIELLAVISDYLAPILYVRLQREGKI